MRCHICNSVIPTPQYNNLLGNWEPCQTCLDIIFNVFDDHDDVEEKQHVFEFSDGEESLGTGEASQLANSSQP